MTQKQHVEIHRKLWLRRQLYSKADPGGAVYVPYCGDGDIAALLYADREIYGADLDPERLQTARQRLPSAHLSLHDVEQWPFPTVTTSFSLADFDAYGNPYRSFLAFWQQAQKTFPLVCFFTDGLKMQVMRGNKVWDFDQQKAVPSSNPNEARSQYNFWLKRYALPWVQQQVKPYQIRQYKFARRLHMLYWGCVIAP